MATIRRICGLLSILCIHHSIYAYGHNIPGSGLADCQQMTDVLTKFPKCKLRHSKHLKPRSPPEHEQIALAENRKPEFTNCSQYAPTVMEEQPNGTFVFQVQAFDPDPIDRGGKINYSIILAPNEAAQFVIDSETGDIYTNKIFDRDEPAREKGMHIIVRATDNGVQPRWDVCQFKVTILDINDNHPLFEKANYSDKVPQDMQAGREVLRISATDIDDGINSEVFYTLRAKSRADEGIFKIDEKSGIITLDKNITQLPTYKFKMQATATDRGISPLSMEIDLDIEVVESHKKAPSFQDPQEVVEVNVPEDFYDRYKPIVTIKADSNYPGEDIPEYTLLEGRTENTNQGGTFRMQVNKETKLCEILLSKNLDYEKVREYTLTVRVKNRYELAAEKQIRVRVQDVNDVIPYFPNTEGGSVLENEPPGTPVMQVKAIDGDASEEHNRITYRLLDSEDLFSIDPVTGMIKTRVAFDREEKGFYKVTVQATDSSPSANRKDGLPNESQVTINIDIADKNDNSPKFTQKIYKAINIREDVNQNTMVAEVKAVDVDSSSNVKYSIIKGNENDNFYIDASTGKIKIYKELDYETTTSYNLTVEASDGAFTDIAYVEITVDNVNDNPPIFLPFNNNITIEEESIPTDCITTVSAYDPDIPNRRDPQNIAYYIYSQEHHSYLKIDGNGCLRVIAPMDCDPPKGKPIWHISLGAADEGGETKTSQKSITEVIIHLTDINDNAPVLQNAQPVYWQENQGIGDITKLEASDADIDEKNKGPFRFAIAESAKSIIRERFSVSGTSLRAKVSFDREEIKQYLIPITITDGGIPTQTGTSTLTLVIADVNDNAMKPGESSIFVYNYMGKNPGTEIGRVYVNDPDDWDLPDKNFLWRGERHPGFSLNNKTGMITMEEGTSNGTFRLEFKVIEEAAAIPRHSVSADVFVTVKEIPEEAVLMSGSIRFSGITQEEFVAKSNSGTPSKHEYLRNRLSHILNATVDNVDVFTVLHPEFDNTDSLDVRFSAHGSPYYSPNKMNLMVSNQQDKLERELGLTIEMVSVDECLIEKKRCVGSCYNELKIENSPYTVFTNITSFVGVNAFVEAKCECKAPPLNCLNGGTPAGTRCICRDGYNGPLCELTSVGFKGDGWAIYPSLTTCNKSRLSLDIRTESEEGLIFYVGPIRNEPVYNVTDFMALEVRKGYPRVIVDYGSGSVQTNHSWIRVADGKSHHIEILWDDVGLELRVDDCKTSACLSLTAPRGPNKALNVNGPLQVGGAAVDLYYIAKGMGWGIVPTSTGFSGCISNLTFNTQTYSLGQPDHSRNIDFSCELLVPGAITFGIDVNFIVAIVVCFVILLILLLAVVVHRRKTDDMIKDHDDIRENIIDYEEEGGGEGDMTAYDLNVFRTHLDPNHLLPYSEKMPLHESSMGSHPPSSGDIDGFIDSKKRRVDDDKSCLPFDDLRNYRYEGDGDSRGSLSSLASGTDEEDLCFDHLTSYGPRFRKVADIYCDPDSDNESDPYGNSAAGAPAPAPESWC